MTDLSRFLAAWLPVALWAALIFTLSHIPGLGTGWGVWDWILRKTAHMVEFAVLTVLMARALTRTKPGMSWRAVCYVSGWSALLYAVSDEVHQAFVPGRTGSVWDVMIDGVGVVVALWIMGRLPWVVGRRSHAGVCGD